MTSRKKTIHSLPMDLLALGVGIILGAVGMFLLDPQSGRRRRALVRDQGTKALNDSGSLIHSKARHLTNRASGVIAETRSALATKTPAVASENPSTTH